MSWVFASGGLHDFSPDTLETSSRSEILLPLTDLPIYRSPRSSYRYDLVQYLIEYGYWSPVPESGSPIRVSRWNTQWRDGQSDLHRQFAWYADDWIAWTEQHPELADVLWPEVLAMLRSEDDLRLMRVQHLMWAGRTATTVDEYNALIETDAE